MPLFTRKKFLAAIILLFDSFNTKAKHVRRKELIVHHVLFWLKDPFREEDKYKLLAGLITLKKIESHRTLIGTPVPGDVFDDTDQSFSVSLVTYFDDIAGRRRYQNHVLYQAFIRDCHHLWNKQVSYDVICEV